MDANELPEASVVFHREYGDGTTRVEVRWYDEGGGEHGFQFKVANEIADRITLGTSAQPIELSETMREHITALREWLGNDSPVMGGYLENLRASGLGSTLHGLLDAIDPPIEDLLAKAAHEHESPTHALVPLDKVVRAHLVSYRERIIKTLEPGVGRARSWRRAYEHVLRVPLFEEEDTDE